MRSDNRSPYGNSFKPNYSSGQGNWQKPPPMAEDTLRTEIVQIERKSFAFILKENPRGRFLRISEEVQGRRNSIIIPATGLEEFRKVLEQMVKDAASIPAAPSGAAVSAQKKDDLS